MGEQSENTGSVNVMNALEPEENAVLQAISDKLIAPDADYDAEFEQSTTSRSRSRSGRRAGRSTSSSCRSPGPCRSRRRTATRWRSRISDSTSPTSSRTFGEYFLSLGEFEGKHYGIPTNINLKSMVWYAKDDFDAAGYTVPESFDDLVALSDQMVQDGNTPWCVGFESRATPAGRPPTGWKTSCSAALARIPTASGSPTM